MPDDAHLVKSSKRWLNSVVYIGAKEYNKVEAFAVEAKCITSRANDRFAKICKMHKLEASLHGKYRNWLLSEVKLDDGRPISPDDIPMARGNAVRMNMKFPYPSGSKWRMFTDNKNKYLNPKTRSTEDELLEATLAQLKLEIRPQKSSEHMHFAKASDYGRTFGVNCVRQCKEWRKMHMEEACMEKRPSDGLSSFDRKLNSVGDVYARANMVNEYKSSSTQQISKHDKMCFTNFVDELVDKIDTFLPRIANPAHPWGWNSHASTLLDRYWNHDSIMPTICRKLFNIYWKNGKGRGTCNDNPNKGHRKAKLPTFMPKFVEDLDSVTKECFDKFTCDGAIYGQSARAMHSDKCRNNCGDEECFQARVAYASEIVHSFLAQKQGRIKAVAAGRRDPRSTIEALEADPVGWSKSIADEYPKLVEMGVIDDNNGKGYTWQELEDQGIYLKSMKAVPLGLYHTHHYDKEGNVDRMKTRAAVKGHSGNMTKGIHYSETFAATPREDTSRILSAIAVRKNLKRKTGDVEKAFCWSKLPPGKQLALKLPPGLKRFRLVLAKVEETFAILRKNLYGTPPAGNAWATLRDRRFLERLNLGLWQCVKSVMDPTLFYIRYGGIKVTECRLIKMSKARSCYEDFNPTDFKSFTGTEFDIIKRVTLATKSKPAIQVLETSKPMARSNVKDKLEGFPNVHKVFDKKPTRFWGGGTTDLITEFTYLDHTDTGTLLQEAWVSIHTGQRSRFSWHTR